MEGKNEIHASKSRFLADLNHDDQQHAMHG